MAESKLVWQSKLVLLIVLPFAGAEVVLQTHFFLTALEHVAIATIGVSLLFGLVVIKLRAGTPAAAFSGALMTGCLMFSTATFPYYPWQTALVPVLAVFVLAFGTTRLGRVKKEQLGIAERRRGRTAAQVAANLGNAALVASPLVQLWMMDAHWFTPSGLAPTRLFAVSLATLAEAAADTVSSEIGQVLGGSPRMITTLRVAEPGTDGAVSVVGTMAGVVAGCVVAGLGTLALRGDVAFFWISAASGVFGLFFDSVLGGTFERRGWLNNDMVNFLSTGSAAGFAFGLLAVINYRG